MGVQGDDGSDDKNDRKRYGKQRYFISVFFLDQGTLQRDDSRRLYRIFFAVEKRDFIVKVRRRGCRCQRQGLLLMELESCLSNYVPRIFTNGLPKIPHSPEEMFSTETVDP